MPGRQSHAAGSARQEGEQAALDASLEIQRDIEAPAAQVASHAGQETRQDPGVRGVAQLAARKSQDFVDLGMAEKEIAGQVLHEPGDTHGGIARADQVQSGKRPQDVAHRSEADEEHVVVVLEAAGPVIHRPRDLTPAGRRPRPFDKIFDRML